MMKLNDQQLSDILKQVPIPSDLKAQLRDIPHQEALTESAASKVIVDLSRNLPKSRWGRKRAMGWLSLTSAAVLVIGLIWTKQWEPPMVSQIDPSVKRNSEKIAEPENQSPASDVGTMSRELDAEQYTLVHLQSEIDDIERQIDAIDSERLSTARYQLDHDEGTSLLIATASQTAILSGVSIEYLRRDLEESIRRFPETPGSMIAAQLLASATTQN